LDLFEVERQLEDVARTRLHGGAEQLGGTVLDHEYGPDVWKATTQVAHEVEHGQRTHVLVNQRGIDLETAQRRSEVAGARHDPDDAELLVLFDQGPRSRCEVSVGDREQSGVRHGRGLVG
jgi:hypothetical protein